MHKTVATALTLISIVFVIAAACGTDEPASQPSSTGIKPLDPATATLDQIIERTRTAMSEITSYKTRGALDSNLGHTGPSPSNEFFTEWQYPDRHRNQIGPLKGEGESGFVTELLSIGDRNFARLNGSDWQEQQPRENNEDADQSYGFPLIDLDASDVKLISTDEITKDGVRVFRLEFRGYPVAPTTDSDELLVIEQFRSRVRVTLLIDQKIFRYETVIIEEPVIIESLGENESNVDATANATPGGSTITYDFYGYNEPVDIELPTGNVRLLESNPLATPDVAHTPTATALPMSSKASE